ncbi:MAG: SDR family NAD(P)-dependent oxidoreductase [Elusimicrobia bacterium]|nr:SDR family NAD(P)-dependent oxidoreductase [Elusimicrobiota bacterium]
MPEPLDPAEPIAIVGLGGVFPGAKDIPAYWRNILGKVDSIIEVPADRWDWRLYHSDDRKAEDKTYSKIGGFIRDFTFDPLKLRIPPGVARQMDTVQQLAVAATAEALKDAGLESKPFDRARCAVVFGNSMGGPKKEASDMRVYTSLYLARMAEAASFKSLPAAARETLTAEVAESVKAGLMEITEDTMPGELSNVIAGRVANVFNLNGANFTVDAACAASLGAVAQAVNGLRFRQFDTVVTGGVDQMMAAPAYVKFSKIGALSPDGSRPFDAGANGFVMGEGCGVMVLKRLSDALRDGDRVYALIRTIGASSDGRGKGITAPNPKGQKLAMERAFEGLDYGPADVGLLEAHGTSTPVGDVVEVQTAAEVFRAAAPGSVALGSVKSQIGHLKAAAGAAGLVKAALALYHKTLPPSINFKTPNPGIDWSSCPFSVNVDARPWESAKPRRANVSAFGFGGTNFHITLEEATPATTSRKPSMAQASASLLTASEAARPWKPLAPELGGEAFCLGGPDEDSVLNSLERAAAEAPQDGPLTAYAAEVNARGAVSQPVRLSVAAESAKALRDKTAVVLKARGAGIWEKTPPAFRPKSIHAGRGTAGRPKVAFLFPGQGSQYVDMLKDLREKYQVVADTFAEADRIMTRLIGEPLSDILFTKGGEDEARLADMAERIKRTEITQPAVLTADVAILRLLRQFGVEPDMVAGHSLGEYGALVAADILTFEQALDAVSARGREMAGVKVADNGKMASVAWPAEKVESVLKQVSGYVIAANKNCRIQTVIAGASAAVERAVELFKAEGVQAQLIEVSHAFHSEIVAPATEPYGRFLERIQPKAPKIPVLSNVTADYYPSDPAEVRALMTRQIASPVEWISQIQRMYADGVRIFVECGPKRALTAFVTSTLGDKKDVFVASSNHPKKGGIMELNDMLARFVASGIAVDFSRLDPAKEGNAYTPEYRAFALGQKAAPVPSAPTATLDAQALLDRWDLYLGPVVVSGLGAGVPGSFDKVFREDAIDRLIEGQNLIDKLPLPELHKQVEKNLERVVKSETGNHGFERMESIEQVIRLAGRAGAFDISGEFGVRGSISSLMDRTAQLALASGILALKDAKIPLVRHYKRSTTGSLIPTTWSLPVPLQAETGVILATAWPGLDSLIEDMTKFFAHKYAEKPARLMYEMYDKMIAAVKDPADRQELADWYARTRELMPAGGKEEDVYKFSRSFIFRVLSLGHAQTAQFIGAKGPCTQVNAACASTTQAVGIAEDWIRTGRAKRVLVISADDITNENSFGWMGTGFLASGAATTKDVVSEAALPFDRRRNGMIIGMGAAALVIEDGRKAAERGVTPLAEVLATQFDNSAYHLSRLSTRHVSETMGKLMAKAEKRHGLRRSALAPKMLFMSHETYTPAQGGSSAAEVEALKATFGPDAEKVVVTNTKGFTGHSMGASLEDVVAVRAMNVGRLPPIANYKEPDPNLTGITLSKGGAYDCEFALRLGAGFGSQIAMSLMRRTWKEGTPRVDEPVHKRWLGAVTGRDNPELEVVHNTLRVKDAGKPAKASEEESYIPPPSRAAALPAYVPPPVAAAPKGDEAVVTREVVALVMQKTGYPAEMLELDLDMEADLGIDTVKQAELIGLIRDTYGISKEENLSLKDYPTLRDVIRFVLNGGAAGAAPAPAPVAATPAPAAAPAPVRTESPDETAATARIVALVSEKTGYPAEMLELDLDMEADLGIDTVKQAELIGIIRDEYGIAKGENLSLKDYPTLRHVVGFVMAGAAPTASEAALPRDNARSGLTSETVPAPAKHAPIETEEYVRADAALALEPEARFDTWSLESYPRPADGKVPKLSKEAPVVILAVEPEAAAPYAEAVTAAGGEAVVIKGDWSDLEKAEAVLTKALKKRPCGGLVDITALTAPDAKADDMTASVFEKAYSRGPRSLFLAAKVLQKDLSAKGAFLLVLTRTGGDHGCSSGAEFSALAGASAGLAKALARELPAVVRAVDFDVAAQPADMVRLALEEVGTSDPRLEVGWRAGTRLGLRLVRRPRPADAPRKLSNRSVVMITGGGQGLGAELAKEIARRSKCQLVLVGRTALATEAASWVRMSPEELDAMKKRLWEDLKNDKTVKKATPALLEREFSKVRKAIDLHRAIEAMSLAGSKVLYLQADMADGASVAKAVKAALKAHGRIDFVIHAAGLDESKALADKKPEDFDRVFKAKAHGAFNLVKNVPPVRGQRWAFLSSVTGRFGNFAQTDYAAANDFLAKLSASMNAKRRGAVADAVGGKNLFTAPAVTFDLTAFADIGMATRGSVEKFLKAQGVDFMPPAEGVRLMLEILLGDAESHEVLIAGALGKLDAEGMIVHGEIATAPSAVLEEGTITKEIVALVVEKTGYPAEMLELDLDMEADLGIDTVKQAELIGLIRDKYAIPKAENLSLKDYPTLRHVVGFVMKAPTEGAPAAAAQDTGLSAPAGLPLFDELLSKNGDGTKTGKTFSLESDPWLKDHAISGTPYVAGVMGLELFVATAAKRLGKTPSALEDVRFALPIKLLRQRPVTVRTLTGDGPELRIESDFVSPQGIKLGAPRVHFTARVAAGLPKPGSVEAKAAAKVKGLGREAVVKASAIYAAYFHGPRFQVLAGLAALGEEELVGLYRRPKTPLWDKGARGLVFQPMLIEAAFQTCGYRDLHYRKKMTLPDSIEKVRVYDAGPAPEELFVYARWRGAVPSEDGADLSLYDACVLDGDGKVWAAIEGYRMIAVS